MVGGLRRGSIEVELGLDLVDWLMEDHWIWRHQFKGGKFGTTFLPLPSLSMNSPYIQFIHSSHLTVHESQRKIREINMGEYNLLVSQSQR